MVAGGTVSFYDGAPLAANFLGTSTAVVGGTASIVTAALAAGSSHTITAVYSGASNFAGSTGTLASYAVGLDNTFITVTAAPSGADQYGQTVTLTAAIGNSNSSAIVTGGTVSFYDGAVLPANLLGTSSAVTAGTASITTASLSVGNNHTITAVYTGAANFAASTGALNPYAVAEDTTATTLSATPAANSVFGQSVTLAATVANMSSLVFVNGGTVSFYNGATLLGTSLPVVNGLASITTTALPVNASLSLTAVYAGDGVTFQGSTGTLSYAVSAASTTTTVAALPSSPVFDQAVTFTATVLASNPSAAVVNGGTVSFYDGAISPADLLGVSGAVANGTASITTGVLAAGGHTITAVYSGDGLDFNTSTGTLAPFAVNPAGTSTTVSAAPANSDVYGAPVTLTANVAATAPSGATVNSGTVSFYDGAATPANLLAVSATVSGGTTSITTSALPVGAIQTITAVYSGAANFAGSTGILNPYTVAQANTATVVTSSAPVSGFGQAVTLTATVAALSPSAAIVNGGIVNLPERRLPSSEPQRCPTARPASLRPACRKAPARSPRFTMKPTSATSPPASRRRSRRT